ncbi:hypothetical protein TraAM80_08649 [Trypanosoma rangeli]|uniref:Uncharacterized protein n=1 Tax=Trypanosoma rangeli TaxID=5698 RepID=A0A422MZK4_TRYRA|nr:uncharacterized protein TraAM80_08649 [Trypanosoma rangeli]RNE98658.1 hypothetical protein TraAM80_08649 [Trypanosoma rangeli]|eukprot:RNE98658.1 hypothetical protein TraAM80_08649 [Trypanosoma rangeli]
MKLTILGAPVVGKVHVDITPSKPFGEVLALIQEAVDNEALWHNFRLHFAEVHDRKVVATTRVIQSTDTADSLGLPSSGAVLVLRPLDSNLSAMSKAMDGNSDAASTSQTSTRGDYRSRMIAIYQKYEPSKVGTVDASLLKFKGKEEAVIRHLMKKYGSGPDSVTEDSLHYPLNNNNDTFSAPSTATPASPGIEKHEKTPVPASNKLEGGDGLPGGALQSATPASAFPHVLKDNCELQVESYGFQAFISPTEQEPLGAAF